jgi:hypothetical protein
VLRCSTKALLTARVRLSSCASEFDLYAEPNCFAMRGTGIQPSATCNPFPTSLACSRGRQERRKSRPRYHLSRHVSEVLRAAGFQGANCGFLSVPVCFLQTECLGSRLRTPIRWITSMIVGTIWQEIVWYLSFCQKQRERTVDRLGGMS